MRGFGLDVYEPESVELVEDARGVVRVGIDHEDAAELPLALLLEEVDLDGRVDHGLFVGDYLFPQQHSHDLFVLPPQLLVSKTFVFVANAQLAVGDVEVVSFEMRRRCLY